MFENGVKINRQWETSMLLNKLVGCTIRVGLGKINLSIRCRIVAGESSF